VILTYRYRLLPTRQQHAALARILEDQRQLYNDALAERIDAYQRSRLEVDRGLRQKPRSISYIDQTNSLTVLRNDPLLADEFSRYPAFLQHWTLRRLNDAYAAFFKRAAGGGAPGFPKFRGRAGWRSFGFSQNGGFRFDGRRVRFKGMPGGLRLHLHRPLPGDVGALGHRSAALRSIVLTRDVGGRKWWIALMCEVAPQARCRSATACVGVDVNVLEPLVQSDGVVVPLPAALRPTPGRDGKFGPSPARKAERRAARALARARRGSRRRDKARMRLAKVKAKAAAVRRQYAHVQAARLARSYAVVAFEALDIQRMTRSAAGTRDAPGKGVAQKAELNREILNVGWGDLIGKHAYKAERDQARHMRTEAAYTSQTCCVCGAVDAASYRSSALFVCTQCRRRDSGNRNAAQNLITTALGGAGVYSKLYLRGIGGRWELVAWGVHALAPSWQERTAEARRAARQKYWREHGTMPPEPSADR
jgi:putative transposase